MAMEHQSQHGAEFHTVPIRGLDKFAVDAEGGELLPMIGLDMKVDLVD